MSQTDTITVQVKDAALTTAVMTYAIPVISLPAITVIDPLPSPTQGVPYTFAFSVIGGVPPYSWTLGSGGGVALAAGWSDPLPGGSIGAAYSYTLSATGGTPPYSYSVTAGTLPTGLSLNGATGLISGTPSVIVSLDAITLAVTDSSTGGGGGGGVGQTGGNTYVLSSAGVLTCTPTVADADTVTPVVTDSNPVPQSSTGTFNLVVTGQSQVATPTFSPVGGTYASSQAVTISCSTPSSSIFYTTDGTTPTIPPAGSTQAYASPITVATSETVKAIASAAGDTNSAIGSATYTIGLPPLTALWSDPLQGGSVGAAYSYTLSATGGQTPYTYSITAGTLPGGLSLVGSTGVISGTPTTIVSADAVTFAVTDSS